jgi:hypothetical protein
LDIGAACERFDAYSMRQSVTESSYINSLANLAYRSTIKTLPATLPEPTARYPGPRSERAMAGFMAEMDQVTIEDITANQKQLMALLNR